MNLRQVCFATVTAVVLHVAACAETPVGRFVDVKPVAGLDIRARSPSISENSLTMYFSSSVLDPGVDAVEDIWVANRNNKADPFGAPVQLDSVNSDVNDREPQISTDGETLVFTSRRSSGDLDLWMATRESPTGPFGNVTNLGNVVNTSSGDGTGELSGDKLTLYFTSDRPGGKGSFDLYSATRTTEDDNFGDVVNLADLNTSRSDGGPSLSADELTMFYSNFSTSELWIATRDSIADAFDNPMNLDEFSLGSDINTPTTLVAYPSIDSDWPAPGSKLYFIQRQPNEDEWRIHEATWVIPEPSTAVLSCLGFACLLAWRRKKPSVA